MEYKRVQKKIDWTPEDRARHKAVRAQFQRDKPSLEQLLASGEYEGPFPLGVYYGAMSILALLRPAREAAGLSLTDLEAKTGIDRSALSRLESGQTHNPTLHTVLRYLAALGKTLECSLAELPESMAKEGTEPAPATDGRGA
jgi:DNA-binding Xre family transcriptional regulator